LKVQVFARPGVGQLLLAKKPPLASIATTFMERSGDGIEHVTDGPDALQKMDD
jgi:hypothetical protein